MTKKSTLVWGLMVGTLVFTQSCKKFDDVVNPPTASSLYAVSQTAGVYPNQTTYLRSVSGFPTGVIGTETANESASSALTYHYGNYMYQNNFGAPATLHKFSFDGNTGKASEVSSFAVAGLKTIGAVDFISETQAYACVAGYGATPKLIRFNPTTMTITSTIDLTSIQRSDAVGGTYYLGLVHRDNYLYLGVNYQGKFDNLEEKVFVTIVDMTTDKFYKLISDMRSSEMWNGGTEASFQASSIIKDASNDIYVMGYANNGKPSGILRIKSGATDFDPSYFFDLNATTGKPCLGILYFGAGQVFTVRYDNANYYPFDTDYSGSSAVSGAVAQYYKIDLAAKTTSGNISASMPKFFGVNAFATSLGDGKIYFNVPSTTSNDVYSYQTSNSAVAKEFSLKGLCNGFAKIN